MEQFTPGAWVAQNWVSSDNGDFPIEINAAGWPKGKRIAKLDFTAFDSFGHDNIYQPGEAKANAALIAAAPELYEALRGILEIGKRDMSNPKYDGYFDAARGALKKANPQL